MSEQEQDMMTILQKMQQQLGFLEKKIDMLLAKSESQPKPFSKPFGNRGGFSKPFRPFNRGPRPETPGFGSHRDGGAPRREGGFSRPDRGGKPGGDRPQGNWAPRKKPFFGNKRERNQ